MFETSFFTDTNSLLAGVFTGFVFGFLLQKAAVARFDTIVGQFLLRDFTVLKVMLTAIIVGGVGIYALLDTSLIAGLHLKSATLAANALGGVIFGVGMAIAGYCPGTAVAALGEGSKDAIAVLLGMLAGTAAFSHSFPLLQQHVLKQADFGEITLAQAAGISPWAIFAILAVLALILFRFLEQKKL